MIPATQQGLKVLGIPIGHEAFVQRFLENKTTEQKVLFQRIPRPTVSVPRALLMCGPTRANFWLRALRREDTESFARRQDENVWTCLRQILGSPNARTPWPPLHSRQVGLDSVARSECALQHTGPIPFAWSDSDTQPLRNA